VKGGAIRTLQQQRRFHGLSISPAAAHERVRALDQQPTKLIRGLEQMDIKASLHRLKAVPTKHEAHEMGASGSKRDGKGIIPGM
jgi:hypothetical protein